MFPFVYVIRIRVAPLRTKWFRDKVLEGFFIGWFRDGFGTEISFWKILYFKKSYMRYFEFYRYLKVARLEE